MTLWKRRIILGLPAALIAVGAILWVWGAQSPPAAVVVPVPNGYDCISKTPALVVSADEPPARGDKDFSLARAKHYLTNNEAVLAIVQASLTNQWAVPFGFSNDWLIAHCSHDLPQAKRIAQLFSCAGYVAEQEGRFHDAAKLYLDGLNFGSSVGRGGLLIDALVSVADENIALRPMQSIVPKLDVNDCRFVLEELEKWRTNRPSFELTVQQEKKWADVFGRLQDGVLRMEMLRIIEMIKTRSLHPTGPLIAKTRARYESVLPIADRLRVSVAARAFELEHKSPPTGWVDLVPHYLSAIPIDPETKRPLAHQF